MENAGLHPSTFGLEQQGYTGLARAHWNLHSAALVEHAVIRGEGHLDARGALVVSTGEHTGRSPQDKFIVDSDGVREVVDWGKVNVAIGVESFERLHADMRAYLKGKDVFVQDLWAGADTAYRLPLRVITENAWQSLFARALLLRPELGATAQHRPEFTILDLPGFRADPGRHGTRTSTCIVLNFERRAVLIGGTGYAGEIKKSVFTILNHLLPDRQVLPMHCAANIGEDGDTALFFGLSGTGKTTLSADPDRRLIGDDEHGWSDHGVFNFEGGCYAKCIRLSRKNEPQIYNALRFGSVLENVVLDPAHGKPDFDDASRTENTRAAYPLEYIKNVAHPSVGSHPRNIVFLTCDAFGVLPPLARLTEAQAMYHFLSGYTAKVAGTERGVIDPEATFSTLFGAPFFTRRPLVYAEMLGTRLRQHQVSCWLVNTGWSGGPYGIGQRINLPYTREMLHAALTGQLQEVGYETDPVFGLGVPRRCPRVPTEILMPRNAWADKNAYDQKAQFLAGLFRNNFKRFEGIPTDIAGAGPQ